MALALHAPARVGRVAMGASVTSSRRVVHPLGCLTSPPHPTAPAQAPASNMPWYLHAGGDIMSRAGHVSAHHCCSNHVSRRPHHMRAFHCRAGPQACASWPLKPTLGVQAPNIIPPYIPSCSYSQALSPSKLLTPVTPSPPLPAPSSPSSPLSQPYSTAPPHPPAPSRTSTRPPHTTP